MAVPSWIITAQGDLIPLGPSPLLKITREGNSIILTHADGQTTNYSYNSATEAATAFSSYVAVTEAQSIGSPEVYAITPGAVTGLPQNITVTGINFVNALPTILIRNYVATTALVTLFNSSTSLTATVPNTVGIGTYDIIYSDSNGNTAIQGNGLVVY